MLSLKHQTYPNIEVILSEGGSEDDSPAICDSWEKEWDAVSVIHDDNHGVSVSRNRALDRAEGEFVTFVDSDDWLAPEALMILFEAIRSADRAIRLNRNGLQDGTDDLPIAGCDAAGCGFSIRSEYRDPEPMMNLAGNDGKDAVKKGEILSGEEFLKKKLPYGDTRCWSKLYRRETIGDLRFKVGMTIGEDMLFVLDFMKRAQNVVLIEDELYCYFQNTMGAMKRRFRPSAMDQIYCWEAARERLSEIGSFSKEEKMHIQSRIDTIIITSALLTAGRIAELGADERRQYEEEIEICRETIKRYSGAASVAGLSKGYQVKRTLFLQSASLYLKLYHAWKR